MKADKGLIWYFPKDAHQKSDEGSVRSDLKKLDPFILETSKNHLIRNFLRNGRVRVNLQGRSHQILIFNPFIKDSMISLGKSCLRLVLIL